MAGSTCFRPLPGSVALTLGLLEMAARDVLSAFEKFQKERIAFVSAVADMAKHSQVSLQNDTSGVHISLGCTLTADHLPR